MKDDAERIARFEELYRGTRADLLRFLVRRSAPEDAADLLAETYLVAWRKLDGIPSGGKARLWIFGVARNLLMKGYERSRAASEMAALLAQELQLNEPRPTDNERADDITAALSTLPPSEREIVTLNAWDELAPREIAVVVGLSASAVRIRLHRARRRLRKELEAASARSQTNFVECVGDDSAPYPVAVTTVTTEGAGVAT